MKNRIEKIEIKIDLKKNVLQVWRFKMPLYLINIDAKVELPSFKNFTPEKVLDINSQLLKMEILRLYDFSLKPAYIFNRYMLLYHLPLEAWSKTFLGDLLWNSVLNTRMSAFNEAQKILEGAT